MRILLTNHNLDVLGGTETWTKTMAEELTRLGHEVHLFSASGLYNLMPNYPRLDNNYDLALINHSVCLSALEGFNIKKRIFTSHGIIPELERPIEGADLYVSVSEEVQAHIKAQGFESTVIRNPIDTDKFIAPPVNEKLTNVLFLSNYQGDALKVISDATVGYNLEILGGQTRKNALELIQWADLVIGLGRSALEAMSCGRNVIVYDYAGAEGYVTPKTMMDFRTHNCSGRNRRLKLTVDDLKKMYAMYDPRNSMRDYILNHNNVRIIAQEYLSLN